MNKLLTTNIIDEYTIEYNCNVTCRVINTNVTTTTKKNKTIIKFTEPISNLDIDETYTDEGILLTITLKNEIKKGRTGAKADVSGSKINGSVAAIAIDGNISAEKMAILFGK